jgi:endonuclease/exonuclease/phosphatase family metal-dependent hydrolase
MMSEEATMSTNAARRARLGFALVALLVVVVGQMTRLLFPILFEIGEDWDFIAAGVVALGVFCAPVLALLAARLRSQRAVVAGGATCGGALVVAQLINPIPAVLAVVLVAVTLAGGALVVTRVVAISEGQWFVLAVLVGLAVDVAVRASSFTWDFVWHTGISSLVASLLLTGALVATAAGLDGGVERSGLGLRPVVLVVTGAVAALELLFLTNIGFAASQSDVATVGAAFVVLLGLLAAVVVWGVLTRVDLPRWWSMTLGVAAVLVAWLLTTTTGWAVALFVVMLQVAVSLLFAMTARQAPASTPSSAQLVVAATAGSVLFLVLVLLWQLDIDEPLPFPRQTIPAVAAAVIAVVALRSSFAHATYLRADLRAVVAIIAILTVTVPLWLFATAPAIGEGTAVVSEVRLVNYNVRGAVDVDGQLRPDRVGAEIRSSDPNVVVLQEVGRGWPIHATLDLLAYLSRDLDMEYVYVPAADNQFGNAILSNLPMQELDGGPLPDDGTQRRSYIMVDVATAQGPLAVVATHLHSRSVPQITALLDAVDGRMPAVIAGDMNFAPDDPEVALFTEAGFIDVVGATGDPCRTTSAEPTSACDRPDWVFVTPDIRVGQVEIGETVASDHLAMHVSLTP